MVHISDTALVQTQLMKRLEHGSPQLEPYVVVCCSQTFSFQQINNTFTRTEGTSLPLLQQWFDSQTDTILCSILPSSRLRRAQVLCLPLAKLMPYPVRYMKGGWQSCSNFFLEAVFWRLAISQDAGGQGAFRAALTHTLLLCSAAPPGPPHHHC